MSTLSFEAARACVLSHARAAKPIEIVGLDDAAGRVLAANIFFDRDYPPLDRSVRDGFAVRSTDLPGVLSLAGEIRAGEPGGIGVEPGEAIEIMTGAPVPHGADQIVMVEHVSRDGATLTTERPAAPGEFISQRGCEAHRGELALSRGSRLGFSEIALLATVGAARVPVYQRPRIAILATGDEVVAVEAMPEQFQVRNSNSHALAVQVRRAGGIPSILPVAGDTYRSTRDSIERGLKHDLLLLSGGVSAGKYDLVEKVLADLKATFFFDRVLIQPGQPLVFGRTKTTFFFGLPGNPVSAMLTFEVFARAAVELIAGASDTSAPIVEARLTHDFKHKPGLTRFLPAKLSGSEVTQVKWQGSSDVPALTRANAFLVVDAERESWKAGDAIRVWLK